MSNRVSSLFIVPARLNSGETAVLDSHADSDAARFISALTGGSGTTFQTFDDTPAKQSRLAKIMHGSIGKYADRLHALNEQGAGVFVMINAGDGRGRRTTNVQAVRALFVDLDGAPLEPADIAFLHPGQQAMVKLTAYDFSIYGGFPATLEHISADTLTPDKPGERADSYYQIRVRTRQNKPSGHDEVLPILPGMVATVDIQTGKKTVLHYLLKPIIKTKEMALRER